LQTFKKEERLSEKKIIKELFEKGFSFYLSPFKVVWRNTPVEGRYPAKVMITVSSRNFRNAVDRNRIRRIVREVYRKNKQILYESITESSMRLAFVLIYTGKNIIQYSEAEAKIILILQRLVDENEKGSR
jgi:ribonuclease P protein component